MRLVCLCRYYEGGDLLFRAIVKSLAQLGVPLFFMLNLGFTFAALLYEVEWDLRIDECVRAWKAVGVPALFIEERPAGAEEREGDAAAQPV